MVKPNKFYQTETKMYLVIWFSAVLYAVYHFTVASQKHFQYFHYSYDDFSPGWYILNFHKRDNADFEWETIGVFLNTVYPVIMVYLIFSEVICYLELDTKHQQYFQTLFPIFFLLYRMGHQVVLIIFFQPIFFYFVSAFKRKYLIWITNLVSLLLIGICKHMNTSEEFLKSLGINHFEAYMYILLLCWLNLKCTSFLLTTTASKAGLLDFLSYCFYFPMLFTGPYIPYEDFKTIYSMKKFHSFDVRVKRLGCNILRCAFWFVFANYCLHYIYVNATSFQIEFVKNLDLWSLCGYGYLMGQFFHIKYIVLYGLSTSLAAFENIPVPSLPRCIGRVHLYSDMWKYFDTGLYTFLKGYIFVPSQNLGMNKFLSSFLCFFFVYIWHGIEYYILIWATLNFIGVTLESLTSTVYEWGLNHFKFVRNLGKNDLRRIQCALAAPLLAMSSVSNFYFFAGKEVGNVFLQRALSEPALNKLVLLFMLYCCSNVSMELRDVNAHRM